MNSGFLNAPHMNDDARNMLSVSQLNQQVREMLEDEFSQVWVEGELSNLTKPASGHLYFTIKDRFCQVRCAMFRGSNAYLEVALQNGMQVLAKAKVTLYPTRGDFQLVIQHLLSAGEGDLRRLLEELRQRLEAEGLFATEHKRPLPPFPRAIGVITSHRGAAVCDVLSVLKRRYPLAEVIVYATPVQDAAAGDAIVATIDKASRAADCEVLLLVRGGGSLEDLWNFNLETVARAISRCQIPLITGIGHETDVTIADHVADCRGATPSAAAELAVPDQRVLQLLLLEFWRKLLQCMQSHLSQAAQRIGYLQQRLVHPRRQLQNQNQRLDTLNSCLLREVDRDFTRQRERLQRLFLRLVSYRPQQYLEKESKHRTHLCERLQRTTRHMLELAHTRHQNAYNMLEAVSPQRTLERGYAIATDSQHGRIVSDANIVSVNDILQLRLGKGILKVQVLSM